MLDYLLFSAVCVFKGGRVTQNVLILKLFLTCVVLFYNTIEFNGSLQLFDYSYSPKYFLLCLAEEIYECRVRTT